MGHIYQGIGLIIRYPIRNVFHPVTLKEIHGVVTEAGLQRIQLSVGSGVSSVHTPSNVEMDAREHDSVFDGCGLLDHMNQFCLALKNRAINTPASSGILCSPVNVCHQNVALLVLKQSERSPHCFGIPQS